MTAPVRRVLFVSGSGASNTLRYRVRLAEEALRSRGVRTSAVHFTDPLMSRWAEQADVLVLYRTPANRRVLRLVHHARTRLGIPVTFDTDDLVFHADHLAHIPFLDQLAPATRAIFEADVVRRGRVVPFVDRASASTTPIVGELQRFTTVPVDVLPNGVSRVGARIAADVRRREPDGRVRLGYFSGSATHDDDWAAVEPTVARLMRDDPRVDLWLVGPLRAGGSLDEFGDRVVRRRAVPWRDLPALLAEVDVNLAPLDPTPFTEGKSALKWLEAALVGTPTVATATTPFREVVRDGVTGLLVEPGGDWEEPLSRLVDDAGLREELAHEARRAALEELGPERQADRYLAFVQAAADGPRAVVDLDRLRALADDAGPTRTLGVELEGYPFPDDLAGLTLAAPVGAAALAVGRARGRAALAAGRSRGRAVIADGRRVARSAKRTGRRYAGAVVRRVTRR